MSLEENVFTGDVEDFPSNEEDTVSAGESVFSNDLLLRFILKDSTFNDLKSHRMINRQCNLEATKLLRRNFSMKALIIGKTSIRSSLHKETKRGPRLSFQQFVTFVQNSPLFPPTNFEISNRSMNNSAKDLDFISCVGHIVKSLSIAFFLSSLQNRLFQEIIGKHVPNLETLTFFYDPCNFFREQESTLSENVNFKLLKLKTLIMPGYIFSPKSLSQVLKVVPKIENIYWNYHISPTPRLIRIKTLMDMNLMHLLKTADFSFQNELIQLYEDFLEQKTKTKTTFKQLLLLEFNYGLSPNFLPRTEKILNSFFEENKNSLEAISHLYPLGHMENLEIPVLPNVTELHCCYSQLKIFVPPVSVPLFTRGVNMAVTFPNLKTFKIEFKDEVYANLNPVYVIHEHDHVNAGPMTKVTSFEIKSPSNVYPLTLWVKFFCELFPNAKSAKIGIFSDFENAFKYVWKLGALETLRIEVEQDLEAEAILALDSAFTGFSHETISDLYRRLDEGGDVTEFTMDHCKALRERASIVDLHELRDLTICDREQNGIPQMSRAAIRRKNAKEALADDSGNIFSRVANQFGIQMCQKLLSFAYKKHQ